MMINKRLIGTVSESKRYVAANVALQWCSLAANVAMMTGIAKFIASLDNPSINGGQMVLLALGALAVRFLCTTASARMSYLASKEVKKTLRSKIYEKLLRLGISYRENVNTSEVVQVAVEGVEQLETYFGGYLPQLFYALLAPLTLFVYLSFINLPSALVLLFCVPMIPMAIMGVQRFAKKLFKKYWGQYASLGNSFLENLQGLTTLKIYQADERKGEEMNVEAEEFRKITMRVLTMQLNSITIMDIIAYGGAALGMIVAISQFTKGRINLEQGLLIILLSADFFIPMRLLGSFFHIAMNGMAASDNIFRLLDLPEHPQKDGKVPEDCSMICSDLSFSYDPTRPILKKVNLKFPKGSFTALVGESGSGKSTVSSILMGRNKGYTGSVKIGGVELSQIDEHNLMQNFTYISHQSYLFKGTVRDNLLMGKADATDEELWAVLDRTNLADFLKSEKGLDTLLNEKASNLSGGQCQRLALARALLHDSPVYIFDEATSNIDVESENDIMAEIHELAKTRTVILISHRLANVTAADQIYVLQEGHLVEKGSHEALLAKNGTYAGLWNSQQALENYRKEASA